jgi:uncharacterized membrane protein
MQITLLAMALLVLAVGLVFVGVAGLTERLPRNRWLGIRTQTVRRDDEAWRLGHRAAGAALITAAGPPLLLAVALLVAPPAETEDWFLVYAVVGVVTGGLIALSVRQADRAALGPQVDD